MDRLPEGLADRLRRLPIWSVWLLGSIPLALLVWDVLVGAVGVDPVRDIEHRLGRTTLYLVLVTLCVTPLLRLGRINLSRLPLNVALTMTAVRLDPVSDRIADRADVPVEQRAGPHQELLAARALSSEETLPPGTCGFTAPRGPRN